MTGHRIDNASGPRPDLLQFHARGKFASDRDDIDSRALFRINNTERQSFVRQLTDSIS